MACDDATHTRIRSARVPAMPRTATHYNNHRLLATGKTGDGQPGGRAACTAYDYTANISSRRRLSLVLSSCLFT